MPGSIRTKAIAVYRTFGGLIARGDTQVNETILRQGAELSACRGSSRAARDKRESKVRHMNHDLVHAIHEGIEGMDFAQ